MSRPIQPPRHRRRLWLRIVVALVLLLLVAFAAGGWYFSGRIESGALASTPAQALPGYDDVQVVSVTGGQVTLKKGADAGENFDSPSKFAMAWQGGFGQIGPATVNPDGTVTRSLTVSSGVAPTAGQLAGIDRSYWLGDPTVTMGLPKEDVVIGKNPAWYFPNGVTHPATVAIFVHGQNGNRENGLRFVDVAKGINLPTLVITYRNDVGAQPDPSGLLQYGQTEWVDLDAAVQWALGKGAKDVVLVGQSMGGAIVAAFLENSTRAGTVSAVVLDAPMLSLGESVKYGARAALPGGLAVPDPLLATAKLMATWRYGVDWSAVDYLDNTSWVKVPTLVTHGTIDQRVPVTVARELRDAKPNLLKLVEFPGALHTEAWNSDSARWTQVVGSFVAPYAA